MDYTVVKRDYVSLFEKVLGTITLATDVCVSHVSVQLYDVDANYEEFKEYCNRNKGKSHNFVVLGAKCFKERDSLIFLARSASQENFGEMIGYLACVIVKPASPKIPRWDDPNNFFGGCLEITGSSTAWNQEGKEISTLLRYFAFSFAIKYKDVLGIDSFASTAIDPASKHILQGKFSFRDLDSDDNAANKWAEMERIFEVYGDSYNCYALLDDPPFQKKMEDIGKKIKECTMKFQFNKKGAAKAIASRYRIMPVNCKICSKFTNMRLNEKDAASPIMLCGEECMRSHLKM